MSVLGYFGPDTAKLRLKAGDVRILELPGSQPGVLAGQFSVEEARMRAELRLAPAGPRYGCVGNYDPVLRAHCRLDREDGGK